MFFREIRSRKENPTIFSFSAASREWVSRKESQHQENEKARFGHSVNPAHQVGWRETHDKNNALLGFFVSTASL